MKYDLNNENIRRIIDELGEEYKNLLVQKTLLSCNEYDVNQIDLSALIKLDEKAKEILYSNEKRSKTKRLLSIALACGLIYTVLGIFLILYIMIVDSAVYSNMFKKALLIVLMGIVMCLFSVLMNNSNRLTYNPLTDKNEKLNYDIVNTWNKLEALLVQLTPPKEGTKLNDMIFYLTNLKLLTSEDNLTIKQLLKIRNQVVHSNVIDKRGTDNELKLLKEANEIIKKLEKFNR